MSARRHEQRSAWLLAAPAVVVMAGFALYPIVVTLWLSLRRTLLVFHEDRFVGLEHYAFLLRDPRFWSALGTTSYFTAVSVSIELLLGLAFALLLDASFPGRGAMRAIVLVPWAIPTVVSAKLWAWLFNPDYGLLTHVLGGGDVNFLGTPGWAMHAAILADVWKTTPFVALLLLGGLQSIPRELYLAAQVDGASRARTLRTITLPLLLPTIVVTLVFRTLDAFRVFDAVYVLTDGGPANSTETLSIYAYKTLIRIGDFGYGSTLAITTFLLVAIVAAGYLMLMRRAARRTA